MEATPDIKISVIVPIYNAASYLSVALDGILSQTLSDIEIICVDDASTDESVKVIKERAALDARVKLIRNDVNRGPGAARNIGLAEARGKYVSFLDADDFFEPEMLEALYRLAERDELDVAVCGYDLYRNRSATFAPAVPADEDARFTPGTVTSKSTLPHVIFQLTDGNVWNKLFLRRFLTEQELTFDGNVRLFEDALFVFCALSLAERMNRTEAVLLHHRVCSDQSHNRGFRKYYAAVPDVYLTLKRFLEHRGLYLPLTVSYARLSATRCFRVYNLLGLDAKITYWNRLHNLCEALGWDVKTPDLIPDEAVRDFVMHVVSYTYAQHVRREALGIKTHHAVFTRKQKTEKKRRAFAANIKEFFVSRGRHHKDEDPKI